MKSYRKARIVKLVCGIIAFVLLSALVIECKTFSVRTCRGGACPHPRATTRVAPTQKRKSFYNNKAGELNRITIGVDDSILQKLSKYPISAKVNFASSSSTGEEKLRNLPVHPFSKKILSVTQETSDIFIYETNQNAKSAARYFVREMKRRGWNLCSGRGLASQPLLTGETFLFHNKDVALQSAGKMCLFHAESDSGTTTITVIYMR